MIKLHSVPEFFIEAAEGNAVKKAQKTCLGN